MNTPARRFIVLVIVTVIAVAVLMAPRRAEWLAIMRDDDQQAQIIALMEPRLARNGDDPDVLATLGRAYAEIGNHQRATELLEHYIALRPDDAEAFARLAELYKDTDQDRRATMLQRSLALKPRLSHAIQLADLYRDSQRADDELALLSHYESELTLENGLRLRLARLHAALGDRQGALRLLMRPEILSAATQPMQGQEERLYLAELLVEAGRSAEAVRLGRQWVLQWHEPWLADRLLRSIALHAPPADASELAEAIAVLHPEVRFYLANGLAKLGAGAVARQMLATWSKSNPAPSMIEIGAFMSACRDQGEPGIVWQAFVGELRRGAPNDTIMRYSEAIVAEYGIGALAPFWSSLPQAVIEGTPLLAARLAFHEHDLVLTRRLLDRVDLRTIGVSDRQAWIDLLTAIASPREVFAVLRDRRSSGGLPTDLTARYARVAAGLGREIEYRAALADLRRVDRVN
jgi:tetratricopeptide (TPR) repeat protein